MIQKSISKWGVWFVVLLFTLSSCHHRGSHQVQIQGRIAGLGNDTIYLVRNRLDSLLIDTLFVSSSAFHKGIAVDSSDRGYLLIPDLVSFPLYIADQTKIDIKGDVDSIWHLAVNGSLDNQRLKAFMDSVAPFDLATKRQAVAQYVHRLPDDPIGMFMLKHYFLKSKQPPFEQIKKIIGDMGGKLRDELFISNLSKVVTENRNIALGNYTPSFSAADTAGVQHSRYTSYNKKVVLLHFWASWKPEPLYLNHLRKLYKKYPPRTKKGRQKNNRKFQSYARRMGAIPPELAIVNLSLDVDTVKWKQAVVRDNVPWDQLCDFYGWSSGYASRFAVANVPSLYVIGADSKIVAINPPINKIDSIVGVAMAQADKLYKEGLAARKRRR